MESDESEVMEVMEVMEVKEMKDTSVSKSKCNTLRKVLPWNPITSTFQRKSGRSSL